jgi:hypothetical protein
MPVARKPAAATLAQEASASRLLPPADCDLCNDRSRVHALGGTTMAYAHVSSDFVVPGWPQAGIQTRTLDDAPLARIAEGDRQAMQPLFLRHNVHVFSFRAR